jgi:hypothetical protein
VGDSALLLSRRAAAGTSLLLVCRLRGAGRVDLPAGQAWSPVLTTEDADLTPDPAPPRIELAGPSPHIDFRRPGAVLLRRE